jgi:hypothetical protein
MFVLTAEHIALAGYWQHMTRQVGATTTFQSTDAADTHMCTAGAADTHMCTAGAADTHMCTAGTVNPPWHLASAPASCFAPYTATRMLALPVAYARYRLSRQPASSAGVAAVPDWLNTCLPRRR